MLQIIRCGSMSVATGLTMMAVVSCGPVDTYSTDVKVFEIAIPDDAQSGYVDYREALIELPIGATRNPSAIDVVTYTYSVQNHADAEIKATGYATNGGQTDDQNGEDEKLYEVTVAAGEETGGNRSTNAIEEALRSGGDSFVAAIQVELTESTQNGGAVRVTASASFEDQVGFADK
ncbi:MAG: hypothetical protein WD492_09180 [Alkalispirochaeta sp.]